MPVQHPRLGEMRNIGTPLKMSATPLDPTRRAPMLGEHTDDVLAWADGAGWRMRAGTHGEIDVIV